MTWNLFLLMSSKVGFIGYLLTEVFRLGVLATPSL